MEEQLNNDQGGRGVQVRDREVVHHSSQPQGSENGGGGSQSTNPGDEIRRKAYKKLSSVIDREPVPYETFDKYLDTEEGSKRVYGKLKEIVGGGLSLEQFRRGIGYRGPVSEEKPEGQAEEQSGEQPIYPDAPRYKPRRQKQNEQESKGPQESQDEEEFVQITPDKYPTRGNKSFKKPVSKRILDQSLPVLESQDLVITDGRDATIHKSSKQNSGHSIDVALKDRDYSDEKIANVIKEGKSNNLEFEFESKDRNRVNKLKRKYPEYANNIKYVEHITAPHFSVYHGEGGAAQPNRTVDVAGNMGPEKPEDLERRNTLVEARRLKKEVYDETFNELRKTANPQAGGASAAINRVRSEASKKANEAVFEYLKSSGVDITQLSTKEVGDVFQNLTDVKASADRTQAEVDENLEKDYSTEGLTSDRHNPKSKDGKLRLSDFQEGTGSGLARLTAPVAALADYFLKDDTYMSPEEIMSAEILEDGKVQYKDAKTGDIKQTEVPRFGKDDLLAAKDYVAQSSLIRKSATASALRKRQELLGDGFEGLIGKMNDEDREKFDKALQVSSMSPTEEEIEQMSTDERAEISQAVNDLQELNQKYPNILSDISKYQKSFNEVHQEFEQLERTEQNAVIVEKLNQELEEAASKRYADNSGAWNRLINLKRLVAEAPSRFVNETSSTANAALAMFGHQGAQDELVAGYYSVADDYDIRSYQEKAAGVRKVTMYDKYMVLRDEDGNVQDVLDRDTETPTKDEQVRGPDGRVKPEWLEGFHNHPASNIIERDYNAASIFNQLQQTGSEMAGIVALGMMTGGAATAGRSITGALVKKYGKKKVKKELTKSAVKGATKGGLSKKMLGDRFAEVIGSIGMFSGRSAQDAIGAGFDFDEAGMIGLTKGTAEGLVAAILPTAGRASGNIRRGLVGGARKKTADILKAASEAGTKLDKKALQNLLTVINKGNAKLSYKSAAMSLGKDVGSEILEENIMNYLEPAINRGYNNLASGYFDEEELFDVSWDQIIETSLVSAGAAFLPGSFNAISKASEGVNSEYLSATMKAVMKHPQLFKEYLDDAKEAGFVSEQEHQDMQGMMEQVEQERNEMLEIEDMSEDMANNYAYHAFREKAMTSAAQMAELEGTGRQERFAKMAENARTGKKLVKLEFAKEQARRKGEEASGPAVNVKPKTEDGANQEGEETSREEGERENVELSEKEAQTIAAKIQNDPDSLTREEYKAYEQNRTQVEKYLDKENVAFESDVADPQKAEKDAIIKGEDPSQVEEVVYGSVDGSSRIVTKDGHELVQIKDENGNWKYHPYQSSPRAQNVRSEFAGRPTREQARQEFNESRSPKRTPETTLTQASTVGEAMTTAATPGAQGQAIVTDRATQKRGTIGINHQRGTFEFRYEDDNGNTKVKHLGKVSELKNRSLDELGFATDNQVTPLGDGRFEINGEEYVNEDGQGAVSETRSGKRKVTLKNAKTGKTRRFYTPKIVEDLAYQIYLEEAAQDSQAFENFFQRKIEEYERNVRSNQKQGSSGADAGTTQRATDPNAEGVSEPGQDEGRSSRTRGESNPRRDVNAIYELFFGERKDDSDTYSPATGNLRVSESADNALQRKVLKQLEKALNFISKQMPDLNIQIHKTRESYELAVLKLGGSMENAIETAGTYDGAGTIHINMKSPRLKKNTLFHETLHPVFKAIKDQNPNLYIEMVETVREALNTNPSVADKMATFMKEYSDQGTAVMEEEMLVEFISQVATGELDTTKAEKRGFLQSVRSFLKSSFGYNNADAVSMTDGPIAGQLRLIAQTLNDGIKLEFDQSQANVAEFDPTRDYNSDSEARDPIALRRDYDNPMDAMDDASIDTGSFSSSVRTFATDAGKYAVGKIGEMLVPFYSNGERFIPFAGYDSDGKMIPFAEPETGDLLINSPKLEHASRILNAGFSPDLQAVSDVDTNMDEFQSALGRMVPKVEGDVSDMSASEMSDALQKHFEKYREEPQVRFQIVGRRGAANMDALSFASDPLRRMDNYEAAKIFAETGEMTPKEIKMATGWEVGADGKWRYEIPDGRFKKGVTNGTYKLEDLYKTDPKEDLFSAYPNLRDIEVNVRFDNKGAEHGGYIPRVVSTADGLSLEDRIEVSAGDKKGALSVLVHEIQHAIQFREGFSQGGNTKTAYEAFEKNASEKEVFGSYELIEAIDLSRQALDVLEGLIDSDSSRPYQEVVSEEFIEDLLREKFAENSDQNVDTESTLETLLLTGQVPKVELDERRAAEVKEIAQDVSAFLTHSGMADEARSSYVSGGILDLIGFIHENLLSLQREYSDTYSPYALYQRLRGETEARNVESRLNMTKNQRLRSLLESTEDIAREDQIEIEGALYPSGGVRYQKTPNLNTEGTLVKTYMSQYGEDTIASSRKMSAVYNQRGQATRIDIPKDKILDLSEYNDMYRAATGADILTGALFRIDSESIENSYEYQLERFAEAVGQEEANKLKDLMTNAEHISAPDPLSPSDTDYWVKSMSNIEDGPTSPGLKTRRVDARRTPMDYISDNLDVRTDEGGDFIFGEQFKIYISDFNAPLTINEKPNWVRLDKVQIQEDFSLDEEVVDVIREMKLSMDSAGGSMIFSDDAISNMAESPESEAMLETILEDEGFVETDYGYLRGPENKIPTERFNYEDLSFVKQPNGSYIALSNERIDPNGEIQGTIEFERWSEGFPVIESENIHRQAKTGQSSIYKVYHATMGEFYQFNANKNGRLGEFNFLGNVNYFTNSEYDASVNYGDGATIDNEAKVSAMLDRLTPKLVQDVGSAMVTSPEAHTTFANSLESTVREMIDVKDPATKTLKELGFTPYNTFNVMDAAKAYLNDVMFDSGQAKVLQLFVKSENPIVLNGKKTPFQNYDPDVFTKEQLDSAWAEVKEQFNLESDNQRSDYITEVYQRAFDKHDVDSDILLALNDAIEQVGFDGSAAEMIDRSEFYNSSTVDLNEIYQSLKGKAPGDLIAAFLTNLGFDSMVLQDAVSEFKDQFDGYDGGPVSHVHVPHVHRNKIKLADGRNATFGESADIRFQKVGNKNQETTSARESRKMDVLDRISRAANANVLDKYSVDDIYNNLGKVSDEIKTLGVTKEELRESLNRRSYFEAPKSLREKAKREKEIEGNVKKRLDDKLGNFRGKVDTTKYKRMLRLVKKVEKIFKPFLGNIEFHIAKTPEDFVDQVTRLGGTASLSDKGVYVENAGIVLNFSLAKDVDVIHEGLHPVLNTVFQLRPDLLKSFYNQIEALTDSDSRIKAIIEHGERYAEENAEGEVTNPDEVMDEAVVQFFAEFMSGELDIDIPNMSKSEKRNLLQKIRDIIDNIIAKFITDWDTRKKRNANDMNLFANTLRSAYVQNRSVRSMDLIGEKADPRVLATRDKNFHKKPCP